MLAFRALKPLPSLTVQSSLSAVRALTCSWRWHLTDQNPLRNLSSSSWNKFASATGSIAPVRNEPIDRNSLPAAVFPSADTLSQKQRKIIAVVERALHTVLTRSTSPPHISRYVAYISLSVLSISRDCYVVTIGWDCLDGTLPSTYQQDMQVRYRLACALLAFH